MNQQELIKLGFKKVLVDTEEEFPEDFYYYAISFGDIIFHSGDNEEAEDAGGWYVSTPDNVLRFYKYTELKTVIDIFRRNKIS